MINGEQPPGPSHETLANLSAMLPSFIKGMAKKRAFGRGKPAQVRRPQKVCKVCGLLHDHALLSPNADLEIKPANCPPCQKMLDDGQIALVCGDKYAFATSPKLSDWAGKIVHVSPHVMEAIEKEYGNVKTKKPEGDDAPAATA